MKKCPNCGAENLDNTKFCISCGDNLEEKNIRCPRCGVVNKPNSKFCVKCGYRFTIHSDFETQSISVIPEENLDEEEYIKESKAIKQKVYNYKINNISEDNITTKSKKILEYNEDFTQSESKISPSKMLKIEKRFHRVDFIISLLIIFIGLIFAFFPLAYVVNDGELYTFSFRTILVYNWSAISEHFSWGASFLGNAIAYSLAPLLQFFLYISFLVTSISLFIYMLVIGIKDIRKEQYKINHYLLLAPSVVIFALLLVSISLNENVFSLFPTSIVYLVIATIYLFGVGFYNIYKSFQAGDKTVSIRRILLVICFFIGVLSLFLCGTQLIKSEEGQIISIYNYLEELLVKLNENNNALSFYLGFVGYFLFVLSTAFLALGSYYFYKMIKLFNRFKIHALFFTSFSLLLTITSYILFIISTFYANLDYVHTVSLSAIFLICFTLIMLILLIGILILLKDDNKYLIRKEKKEINNGK